MDEGVVGVVRGCGGIGRRPKKRKEEGSRKAQKMNQ
jgi:hypothetical protein